MQNVVLKKKKEPKNLFIPRKVANFAYCKISHYGHHTILAKDTKYSPKAYKALKQNNLHKMQGAIRISI